MKRPIRLPKQHFTSGDISAHHPELCIFETDKRYAKFANDLYYHLLRKISLPELKSGTIDLIVIKCTMYLEDIVSHLGIWESFVTLNKEMFGKILPFFECDDDYVVNEPNIQDIKYLIWASATELDKESVFNPCARWIKKIAEIIYDFLDLEFDKVPSNNKFCALLYNHKMYKDVMVLRGFLIWLFKDCYLTKGINCDELLFSNAEALLELEEEIGSDNREKFLYELEAQSAFVWRTGPFAIFPKDFLAKMLQLKGLDNEAKDVKEIIYYPKQVYKVEKADKEGVSIISSQREKMFIPSNSFEEYEKEYYNTSSLCVSLVKYKGRLDVNGLSVFSPEDDGFKFNDAIPQQNQEGLDMFDNLMKQSCNTGLLFFKDTNEFLKSGLPFENLKDMKGIVVFLNEKTKHILTFSDIAPIIKSPNNPFYDEKEAAISATDVIIEKNRYIAPFLLHLFKNNFIPDARFADSSNPLNGIKLFQENIEFIARFHQQECWLGDSEMQIFE